MTTMRTPIEVAALATVEARLATLLFDMIDLTLGLPRPADTATSKDDDADRP